MAQLVDDVWKYMIFPLLDDASFYCLQVAFCHKYDMQHLTENMKKSISQYSLKFVKYFLDRKFVFDTSLIMEYAAQAGNLRLLQDFQLITFVDWPWLLGIAVIYGQLSILQYVVEHYNDCLTEGLRYELTGRALESNHLACAQYIIERYPDVLQEEDSYFSCLLCNVFRSGNLDCVKYIIHKAQFTVADIENLFNFLLVPITIDVLRYIIEFGLSLTPLIAANIIGSTKDINVIKVLYEKELLPSRHTAYYNILSCIDIVQFLCDKGILLPHDSCYSAVSDDNVGALRILHRAGYSIETCFIKALEVSAACVDYLVKHAGQQISANTYLTTLDPNKCATDFEKDYAVFCYLHKYYPELIPSDIIDIIVPFSDICCNNFVLITGLLKLGYKWSEKSMLRLLWYDQKYFIAYAAVNNCPWNVEQCFDYLDMHDDSDPVIYRILQYALLYNMKQLRITDRRHTEIIPFITPNEGLAVEICIVD